MKIRLRANIASGSVAGDSIIFIVKEYELERERGIYIIPLAPYDFHKYAYVSRSTGCAAVAAVRTRIVTLSLAVAAAYICVSAGSFRPY